MMPSSHGVLLCTPGNSKCPRRVLRPRRGDYFLLTRFFRQLWSLVCVSFMSSLTGQLLHRKEACCCKRDGRASGCNLERLACRALLCLSSNSNSSCFFLSLLLLAAVGGAELLLLLLLLFSCRLCKNVEGPADAGGMYWTKGFDFE
jgi:hypothetical protein